MKKFGFAVLFLILAVAMLSTSCAKSPTGPAAKHEVSVDITGISGEPVAVSGSYNGQSVLFPGNVGPTQYQVPYSTGFGEINVGDTYAVSCSYTSPSDSSAPITMVAIEEGSTPQTVIGTGTVSFSGKVK